MRNRKRTRGRSEQVGKGDFMGGIEYLETIEKCKQGRPMNERTREIHDALKMAKSAEKYGLKVRLQDDEIEKFYRFTQRCRSAAKLAGMKVSVSRSQDSKYGNIRILMD